MLISIMENFNEKQVRGEELREKVLRTALHLFSKHGYFSTSIHDIRRAANVSIGAIYHHFQNKETLAASLYEQLLQLIEAEIFSVITVDQTCLESSRSVIETLFRLTVEQPEMMQFVLLAQHREYLPDQPPICSSQPFQIMKQAIAVGIENGEVRRVDPWVAATSMFGGALRMMGLQLDGMLDKDLMNYLDEVVMCSWDGIKAR